MLSASSARKWSSGRGWIAAERWKATRADIECLPSGPSRTRRSARRKAGRSEKSARKSKSPGECPGLSKSLAGVERCRFGYTAKSKRAGTSWTLMVQTQQHAQAALLTDMNSDHYGQVGRAKSTWACALKKR